VFVPSCLVSKRKRFFFIVRQHGQLPYTELTAQKKVGTTETCDVYEHWIEVIDDEGKAHKLRRIVINTKKPHETKIKSFISSQTCQKKMPMHY